MTHWIVALAVILTSCAPVVVQDSPNGPVGDLAKAFANSGQFQGTIRADLDGETRTDLALGLANIETGRANTTETQFYIASITKAFTAVLVLQQVQAGTIELDGTIARYFPDLKSEFADQVTIRQMLNHTSGLPRQYTERLSGDGPFSDSQVIDAINASDPLADPGSTWEYSNTAYRMLVMVLEQATGQAYAQLLEENIVRPTGMTNTTVGPGLHAATGYESEDLITLNPVHMDVADRNYFGAGGLFSTTSDLTQFMLAVSDNTLLNTELRDLMIETVEVENAGGTDAMGWAVRETPRGRLVEASGASPGYHSYMAWLEDSPSTNLVWLSNDSRKGRWGFMGLARGSAGLLVGRDVPIEAPATPLYSFLQILLDEGEEAAISFAETLDWRNPPVANAAAIQATGVPDGGIGETMWAWAPATADAGAEWLALGWTERVVAQAVHVQFTQIPGVITGMDIGAGEQDIADFMVERSNDGESEHHSGTMAPVETYTFGSPIDLDAITLHMNTADVAGWPQIDAVGLVDENGEVHWANTATASTSAFAAGGVALHDLPTRATLGKLALRLDDNDRTEEARRVRAIIPRLAN
jgi:CubicO group peptidase (beta-lactamase class C family)